MIVATDYFSKWMEAIPIKKVEQKDFISFIKEHIIHRLGIPQTITTDQGIMFTGDEMKEIIENYGIKHLTSTHTILKLIIRLTLPTKSSLAYWKRCWKIIPEIG